MELLEQIKARRSIRKYQDRQISRADLEKIIEAGTYASNAEHDRGRPGEGSGGTPGPVEYGPV